MRVLILSQYYKPEPVPKPGELAEELRRRGHDVTVLTGFPNYPTGRLYPGASLKLLRREEINGVPVTRTFELPYHGQGIIGRFLNYGSFMASAILGGALGLRPDVGFTVLDRAPFHGPIRLRLGKKEVSVGSELAAEIFITTA